MTRTGPRVSYVVPTLNRGRYVIRAVQSCLDTAIDGVEIEVVVLDSESDDGSFEALTQAFGTDPRVSLLQNRRGLGPTKSWLDGCERVTGDFVTFVWSDDYLAPDFLTVLLPPLQGGGVGVGVAYGQGAIRDIDDASPLPKGGTTRVLPVGDLLRSYHLRRSARRSYPVSPCCSLFNRTAFDAWMVATPAWCQATPLRHRIMWRSGIGPDLMLYFAGMLASPDGVPMSGTATAQFSVHADSITIGSARWPYEAGYWLARMWSLHAMPRGPFDPGDRLYVRLASISVAYGLLLALGAALGLRTGVEDGARAVMGEMGDLFADARERGVAGRVLARTPLELVVFAGALLVRRLGLRSA